MIFKTWIPAFAGMTTKTNRMTTNMFWRRYKTEILIFLTAFGVRLAYAIAVQLLYGGNGFLAYSDAITFLREASNLVHHGVMSQMFSAPYIPDALRTPLYFWFLAPMILLKLPLFGMVFVSHVLAGIAGVLLYRICLRLFDSSAAGIIAAILYSFDVTSLYWGNLLMSDNLFVFTIMLALYFFVEQKFYWFAFAEGIAILARPVGLYFLPVFILVYVIQHWEGRSGAQFRKTLLVSALIIFAVIFPWMLRDKLLFNTWQLTSVGWLNMYIFSMAQYQAANNIPFVYPTMPADYPGQNAAVFSYDFVNVPFYRQHFLDVFKAHPLGYTAFHLLSGIRGMNNHDYVYMMDYVLRVKFPALSARLGGILVVAGKAAWLALYGFALFAFADKKRRVGVFLLLGIFVFNNMLLGYSGVTWGGRYNLPVAPLALAASSYGMVLAWQKMRARRVAQLS